VSRAAFEPKIKTSSAPSVIPLVLQFLEPFKIQTRREGPQMDTATIIAELEAERDRLDGAITALQGSRSKSARTLSGRPDGRRRRLSVAARRKIGEAMKKRWAERKRKAVA
jgi:hypothetical protein